MLKPKKYDNIKEIKGESWFETYGGNIVILKKANNKDTKITIQQFNDPLDLPIEVMGQVTSVTCKSQGINGYVVIMRDSDAKNPVTLAHECWHLYMDILMSIQLGDLSPSEMFKEMYAYQFSELFNELYEFFTNKDL